MKFSSSSADVSAFGVKSTAGKTTKRKEKRHRALSHVRNVVRILLYRITTTLFRVFRESAEKEVFDEDVFEENKSEDILAGKM